MDLKIYKEEPVGQINSKKPFFTPGDCQYGVDVYYKDGESIAERVRLIQKTIVLKMH